MLDESGVRHRTAVLLKAGMITGAVAVKMKRVANEMMRWETKPHLQHGDMRLKNIMADEKGNIKAVLDWENSISAIGPWWDLSIALHDLPLDGQQCFLDGYGIQNRRLIIGSSYIKLFNLLNYAPVIEQLLLANKKQELLHNRARLRGALDLFSL